jgi:hypothetical protein
VPTGNEVKHRCHPYIREALRRKYVLETLEDQGRKGLFMVKTCPSIPRIILSFPLGTCPSPLSVHVPSLMVDRQVTLVNDSQHSGWA